MNNNNKNTEDYFRKSFEDFEVPPPGQFWNEIEKNLDDPVDETFREQLTPLKITPKDRVWKKIKKQLPYHPTLRRYVSWMTRVAAILVVGMLLTIVSDKNKRLTDTQLSEAPASLNETIEPGQHAPTANSGEFVFEVKKSGKTHNHPRQYSKEEEEEVKQLLQFILEDDAFDTDELVINNSLERATALANGIVLVIPENDEPTPPAEEPVELEIKIPLKIVESEQEAEALIQIYESSHRPVSSSDHIQ